jgi:hypothetical protein
MNGRDMTLGQWVILALMLAGAGYFAAGTINGWSRFQARLEARKAIAYSGSVQEWR